MNVIQSLKVFPPIIVSKSVGSMKVIKTWKIILIRSRFALLCCVRVPTWLEYISWTSYIGKTGLTLLKGTTPYDPLPRLLHSSDAAALFTASLPSALAIMAAAQCTKRTRLSISSSYVTNNVYMCQLSSLAAYTRSYLFSYFFFFILFFFFFFFLFLLLPSSLVRRFIVYQSESIQSPNNIFIGY